METILKYSNRKLYSKELKKYVTLPYLLEKINSGADVRVLDHKTKKDVTVLVTEMAKFREKFNALKKENGL